MPNEPQGVGLSKTQKMGFVLLLVFAILAVGLGVLQIRNTIYGPFALNKSIPPLDTNEINSIDALRFRDTDHDGLNDFDELYIYGASPYLADTDSDGIPDKTEVDKGANPLCNEKLGQCVNDWGSVALTGTSTTSSLLNVGEEIQPPGEEPVDIAQALNDPAQIRQMLLKAGVDKNILDSTSDADLMKMVQDILTASNTPE